MLGLWGTRKPHRVKKADKNFLEHSCMTKHGAASGACTECQQTCAASDGLRSMRLQNSEILASTNASSSASLQRT